jgi:hypothetical protein
MIMCDDLSLRFFPESDHDSSGFMILILIFFTSGQNNFSVYFSKQSG